MRPGFAVISEAFATTSQPLPDALRTLWPGKFTSASAAKKAVRRRLVLVGEEEEDVSKAISDRVDPGARIRLLARVAPGPAAGEGRRGKGMATPLRCCYEDDHLAVVYKPPGLSSQNDVRARLVSSLTPTRCVQHEPLWRPQHVHRLDTPTSGLLVVAKTGRALRTLSATFATHQVHKQYRAVVAGDLARHATHEEDRTGRPRWQGSIRLPLAGQSARTDWRVIARAASPAFGHCTLVDLHPLTGRTHQLRRHMASLGCPILGDQRYWRRELPWPSELPRDTGEEASEAQVLMLSAVRLEMPHPVTGANLCVRVAHPTSFDRWLE